MPAADLSIYVPVLHRALAPSRLPRTVAFLHPGLPGLNSEEQNFRPDAYPFSPEAARAQLADLLAFGETMACAKDGMRMHGENARLRAEAFSAAELDTLARFAAGNGAPGHPVQQPEAAADSVLQTAQKILLLAWDLEERLLEIQALEQQVTAAWNTLHLQLHDTAAPSAPPAAGPAQEAPWQAVLAAMAAFLPQQSVLVSGHAGLRRHLLENGMLQPLPEDMAAALSGWDAALLSATLWARVPLCRILGSARDPEAHPGLLRVHDLLVLPDEQARQP